MEIIKIGIIIVVIISILLTVFFGFLSETIAISVTDSYRPELGTSSNSEFRYSFFGNTFTHNYCSVYINPDTYTVKYDFVDKETNELITIYENIFDNSGAGAVTVGSCGVQLGAGARF